MTLTDWLDHKNWRQTDLRRALSERGIDLSAPTVLRLVAGKVRPSRDVAAALHRLTDGAVTPNDFYGLGVPGPAPSAPGGNEEPA